LAELTPGELQYTFFCSTGAEAVEGALKFAKGATKRSKIVSTNGSYHGKTLGALAATGRELFRKQFEPLMPGVVFVNYGDAEAIANEVNHETACVIIEPIQGEGGINIPPPGYLRAIREICDRYDALMIVDEVQTGFGRTGMMFGCNHDNVAPDLMTFAKALGGGVMPIGAVVGTPWIWEQIFKENPTMHSTTFGGNPLACVAGLAAIQVIEEEGLVEKAQQMGTLLKKGLECVKNDHPGFIKEVRGKGLLLGVEFTMDDVGELAIAQMVQRGLVAAYTLNNRRVIRFEPPLIITKTEVEWAVKTFGEAMKATAAILHEVN
jgi:putrescine aminotransferase